MDSNKSSTMQARVPGNQETSVPRLHCELFDVQYFQGSTAVKLISKTKGELENALDFGETQLLCFVNVFSYHKTQVCNATMSPLSP